MSAWIVSEQNTSNLVYNILKKGETIKDHCEILNRHLNEMDWDAVKLFEEMRAVNITSLKYLYDDRLTENELRIGEYAPRDKIEIYSLMQLIKSLSCWLYQSCEDPGETQGDLYRGLVELRANLCVEYCMASEEWNSCEWK